MTSISYNADGVADLQEQLINSSSTIDPTFLVVNKLLSIDQVHQKESAETIVFISFEELVEQTPNTSIFSPSAQSW
ncbi:unnamed protein product, partial [Rotaria socialis]